MGGAVRALLLVCVGLGIAAALGVIPAGLASGSFPLEVQIGATELSWFVDQPFVLDGRAVANDSANATYIPVGGAAVEFLWLDAPNATGANATADSEGFFRLALVGPAESGELHAQVVARVEWAAEESPPYNLTFHVEQDARPSELHVYANDPFVEGQYGQSAEIHGHVTQSAFGGWNETAGPGFQVTASSDGPGGWAESDEEGNFVIVIDASTMGGSYTVTLMATDSAGLLAPGTATVNVSLGAPVGLLLTVDEDSLRFTPATGESFVVHGRVAYTDMSGMEVQPAPNVLVQIMFVNPFQPDLPPSGRTDENGRFQITVLGRNHQQTYNMNVVGNDEATEFNTLPVGISAVVGEGPAPPPNTNFTNGTAALFISGAIVVVIVAVVIAVAAAVALFLVLRGRKGPPPLTPR